MGRLWGCGVCAGVWGCLLLVHSHAGQVPGVLWAPMGSAALRWLPTKPPCSQVTASKQQHRASLLPAESRGLGGAPPVQGPGWEVGWWWHQAAQLCGSQGWVIDGPSTAASVSGAHTPICHLCLRGAGGRSGPCLCTHRQVQGVSAAPRGPSPSPQPAPSSQPCWEPCRFPDKRSPPHPSPGHASPLPGPVRMGSHLCPSGHSHNGGARSVFGGSRRDSPHVQSPKASREGGLLPVTAPALPG